MWLSWTSPAFGPIHRSIVSIGLREHLPLKICPFGRFLGRSKEDKLCATRSIPGLRGQRCVECTRSFFHMRTPWSARIFEYAAQLSCVTFHPFYWSVTFQNAYNKVFYLPVFRCYISLFVYPFLDAKKAEWLKRNMVIRLIANLICRIPMQCSYWDLKRALFRMGGKSWAHWSLVWKMISNEDSGEQRGRAKGPTKQKGLP